MDGIIIVNKEKNCTSHDVVYKIKKMFGKKVGHTGTLDPNATGVLPILIGKGTSLSKYLINHDKKYIATIKLGIKTDTADVEGDIIEEKNVDISQLKSNNLNNIFLSLIGKQMQKPPMYSAIKIKGKKLYEYARSGKSVDIPEREIEIYDLKLLEINEKDMLVKFEIYCSKGTYIRSVCETIAEKLNTVGYMLDLQRTMVGDFNISDCVDVVDLQENIENVDFLKKHVMTVESFFENKPSIVLNNRKMELFLNGVVLECCVKDEVVRVYDEGGMFIGIGVVMKGKVKREIVV